MKTQLMDRLSRFVRETPEATAVVDETGRMTYRELDAFSNAMAHVILPRKKGAGGYVSAMMPRTRFYIASAIGALKAGTAFVFVNPLYPADRINYILDEIDPVLLVTTPELWDEAQSIPHAYMPDYDQDGEYLKRLYGAAKLGHQEAMVKLGDAGDEAARLFVQNNMQEV